MLGGKASSELVVTSHFGDQRRKLRRRSGFPKVLGYANGLRRRAGNLQMAAIVAAHLARDLRNVIARLPKLRQLSECRAFYFLRSCLDGLGSFVGGPFRIWIL